LFFLFSFFFSHSRVMFSKQFQVSGKSFFEHLPCFFVLPPVMQEHPQVIERGAT
jgi:hypothetical protein